MIYLDNAATTQISESVLNTMMPYLKEEYGNPGALYSHGLNAKKAIDKAREQVASFMNCEPDQIVFTSSGSEGNNMIIKGVFMNYLKDDAWGPPSIVISATEHESIINACRDIVSIPYGSSYDMVPPDAYGVINADELGKHLRYNTCLASVMYVNNETGAVNDVKKISEVCHKMKVKFHTDCTQASGIYPLDMKDFMCDYATISAHKLHGPKGVGAVYIKDKSTIVPLISGSFSQEHGLRGGTENVAGIVGFGQACEDAAQMLSRHEYVSNLKVRFFDELVQKLEGRGIKNVLSIVDNCLLEVNSIKLDSGRIINLTVNGVDAQTLVLAMSAKGICISAGSACCAHDLMPSHVLTSMGRSEEKAASSVRISFSDCNTVEDAIEAADIMAENIVNLLGVNMN